MHGVVQGLNVDNFIIRRQREVVEYFTDRKHWDALTDKDVEKIGDRLTGLPSPDDDHETARRFDFDDSQPADCCAAGNPSKQASYQKAIQGIAANLEDKKAIPVVAAKWS